MSASCPDGRRVDISGQPRGIAGVRAMVEVGAEHGVSASTCLRGTGIQLTDTVVLAAQELRVAENLVRAVGCESGLGMEVGSRFSLPAYGVWGYAMLTCPTVRHAVEFGLRYLPLTYAVTDLRMSVVSQEVRLVVTVDADVPPLMEPFLAEREVATVLGILRAILGSLPVVRVELRRFGAPRNAVVADAGVLELPLPHADPVTMAACEHACRVLLETRACPGVVQTVRGLVAEGMVDASAIAARLHLSTRTLRRHLAAERTSLRRLVDDGRRVAAVELLSGGLAVEQIASRLGYTDAATFIRAFRRWTGTTPGAYRVSRLG